MPSLRREVSISQTMSVSPDGSFHSPPSTASWGSRIERRPPGNFAASAGGATPLAKLLKPFKEEDIKILLLENVNQTGKDILSQQGYQVESVKSSLPEDQLIDKIKCVATTPLILGASLLIAFQRHSCPRHPVQNQVDLPSPLACEKSHCGWLLLHWYKSSRPLLRSSTRHLCLQLSLLEFPLCRRARHS